jgi:hypothetical protein
LIIKDVLKEWKVSRHISEGIHHRGWQHQGAHHQGMEQEGFEGTHIIDESTAIIIILTLLLLDLEHCYHCFCLLVYFRS